MKELFIKDLVFYDEIDEMDETRRDRESKADYHVRTAELQIFRERMANEDTKWSAVADYTRKYLPTEFKW